MENDNFIIIKGWMINELELSGTELIIYAIIYGFSQDRKSSFSGSIKYLQKATGVRRSTVFDNLKKLMNKDLIIKESFKKNNILSCEYSANPDKIPGSDPVRKSDHPPSENRTHIIYIIIKKII